MRDIRESPLTIDSVRVGEPNPNQMRELRARARNTADQAVREARLSLEYFDARGLRLGRWTTVHSEPTPFVAARATNEFSLQAFFVPQFTKSVRVDVEFVRFADGGRWPPLDPSLVPASAREATP
ncbi:MAG: hypothetical protein JNL97_08280 [Verrucomicrobiales bacterium]|nr:hypothetical protein [Verrucomicrobiales bacterium]